MICKVFIATSLDGYIADKDGKIDWLPQPDPSTDNGYNHFIETIDAIVMGRNTYETVLGFGIDWPYTKKVFVVSRSLKQVPKELEGKVELLNLNPKDIVNELQSRGYNSLYIDGGKTIQGFLKDDLIDEITISTIPVVLGGGKSLFGELDKSLDFKCTDTKLLGDMVQSSFKRV